MGGLFLRVGFLGGGVFGRVGSVFAVFCVCWFLVFCCFSLQAGFFTGGLSLNWWSFVLWSGIL